MDTTQLVACIAYFTGLGRGGSLAPEAKGGGAPDGVEVVLEWAYRIVLGTMKAC